MPLTRVRAGWRSPATWALAGLVTLTSAASTFTVWAATSSAAAARHVDLAIKLADDYAHAESAVAAEESLERKYRLEPSKAVRARFDAASAAVVESLRGVRTHGGAADLRLADEVQRQHTSYLASVEAMFAAVDGHDDERVLRIDGNEVDPQFSEIEAAVHTAADMQRALALQRLNGLRERQLLISRLATPALAAGLALALLFALLLRRYQAQLDRQRRQAVHEALHDALTGLPNRTLFTDRLGQALRVADREGGLVGLLLLDLDRFKDVNDTLGHHIGDKLLVEISLRLMQPLRQADTVCRLGGDEFAILLPYLDGLPAAMAVAERVRAVLDPPFRIDGADLDVEASVGVVVSGEHGDEAAILLQRADVAMYEAKHRGVGVFAYDDSVDRHSPARLAMLSNVRRALDRSELVLQYQPEVDVHTGRVHTAEALVRWDDPVRGLVPPSDFIPLAEHTGLIVPLTRWVLDTALGQMREWLDAGESVRVAVNLSWRSLLDVALPGQVETLLSAHRIPPDMLQLEVTESAIMTDPLRAHAVLADLAALGTAIVIDDFGAGYTSLSQLDSLPISQVKIDRSFVSSMGSSRENELIVRGVIDLCHNLGLTTVAEGVEDDEVLTMLRAAGCDYAQGFYVCCPLDPEPFLQWLTTGPWERLSGAETEVLLPAAPEAGAPGEAPALQG